MTFPRASFLSRRRPRSVRVSNKRSKREKQGEIVWLVGIVLGRIRMMLWKLSKLATGSYGTRVVKKHRNTDINTCFDGSSQIKTKKNIIYVLRSTAADVSLNILFPFSSFFFQKNKNNFSGFLHFFQVSSGGLHLLLCFQNLLDFLRSRAFVEVQATQTQDVF